MSVTSRGTPASTSEPDADLPSTMVFPPPRVIDGFAGHAPRSPTPRTASIPTDTTASRPSHLPAQTSH
jgi:hypothetical protein